MYTLSVIKLKKEVLVAKKITGLFFHAVLGVRMRSPAWFGEGDEKISLEQLYE